MAHRRTLNSDIKTELINYLERQGSIPSSASGFYKSCEDEKVDFWLKQWGRDSILSSIKNVWSAKPRQDGPGLRKLKAAKKPLPEILVLPKFLDGHHRKILTRFATVRHLKLDLIVKEDNAEMILLALEETRKMVALAEKAAHGVLDTRIEKITTETIDPIPDDDDETDDE